jgi:hypothetical protein
MSSISRDGEERLLLISECFAEYLAYANEHRWPAAAKTVSAEYNGIMDQCAKILELSGRSSAGMTVPWYEPTAGETERVRRKLRQYLPMSLLHDERSKRLTEKVNDLITQICYDAFFPSAASHHSAGNLALPIGLAGFPENEQLEELIKTTRFHSGRPAIDRKALAEDLQICLAVFRIESTLESKTRFVKRTKHLTQVETAAKKLRSLLGIEAYDWSKMGVKWVRLEASGGELDYDLPRDQAWKRAVGWLNAPQSPVFIYDELIEQLDGLILETSQLLTEALDQPPFRDANTPRERLLGKNLPLVFETHFGKSAGGGRTGPYTRFATCAFGIMRISRPAATTVAKAKRDVERKNTWRKPVRLDLTTS